MYICNYNSLLLAPAVYKFGSNGLAAIEPSEYFKNPKAHKFASIKERLIARLVPNEAQNYVRPPFDLYCPSMLKKLDKCICKDCWQYFPCEAAKKRHATCHKNEKESQEPIYAMEVSDEFSEIQEEESVANPNGIPVIENLQEFNRSPFLPLDDPIDGIVL